MVKRILLPIDIRQPKAWQHPVDVAVKLARQGDASLHVLFVAPKIEHNLNRFPEDYRPKLEAWVKESVPPEIASQAVLKSGSAHREIINAAREIEADLIVMGSHDPALKDTLLGSNASSVVLHAPCSVYVVR